MDAEQAAREIILRWWEEARIGWEAEHACEHGTLCCRTDQIGPDRVDVDALIQDVADALLTRERAALETLQERDKRIAALGYEISGRNTANTQRKWELEKCRQACKRLAEEIKRIDEAARREERERVGQTIHRFNLPLGYATALCEALRRDPARINDGPGGEE